MARPRTTEDDVTGDVDVMGGGKDYVPDIDMPEDDEDYVESDAIEDDTDGDDLDPDQELDEQDTVDEDQEPDESDEQEDDEQYPRLEAPANWPDQEKKWFGALPPPLQHAYAQRAQYMQADYTRKTQQLAQVRQSYQDLDRVMQPHEQEWAMNGMNKAQAIHQLIALSNYAKNQPEEFLRYFANLRGVDVKKLANPQQAQQEEYIDPQVAALQKQVAAVTAQFNQARQYEQRREAAARQYQYQQTYQATNDGIEEFANQRGRDGKPLYPHFNELEEDMAALIESKRVRNLHEAYEMAVWANPNTRARMLNRARSQENAQSRQKVERARRAAASISGGGAPSNGYAPATDDMSTRDLLEAAFSGAI